MLEQLCVYPCYTFVMITILNIKICPIFLYKLKKYVLYVRIIVLAQILAYLNKSVLSAGQIT